MPATPRSDARRVFHGPPAVYRPRSEGRVLVLDPEAPHWVAVSEDGSDVLRLCDGRRTVGEIAEWAAARHGLPPGEALARVTAYLDALAGAGFVSERPRPLQPYPGRSAVIRPSLLAELFLFLTNDCNIRCTHCYVRSGEAIPPREMTPEERRDVIRQAKDLGARRFYFTGGEPFLCRDVFDLADLVTVDSDLVILTNGLLPAATLERLPHEGRGRLTIQVSLDGPTAETHEAIRGKGTFDGTVRTIRTLAQEGVPPVVTTAVAPRTIGRLAEQTRFLASLGVKEVHFLYMQDWGRASDDPSRHRIDARDLASRLAEVRGLARSLGLVVDNEEAFRHRVKGPRGRKTDLCGCAYESLAVFSDGEVYPCVWLAGAPDWAAGKATGGRLAETFRTSPVLERLRALSVASRETCSSCEYRFLCGGGNPCASYFESLATEGKGDVAAAEPFCAPYMEQTESILDELAREGGENGSGFAPGPFAPRLFAAMEAEGARCSHPHTENVHHGFAVATARCACVLRADAEEALAEREAGGGAGSGDVFDARGRACVELLLPLAALVRSMPRGAEIDVLSDDPAALVDLPAWCRMTGNELLAQERAAAHTRFRVRRSSPSAAARPPESPAPSPAGAPPGEPARLVSWDAGAMGCGELVIDLKLRLDALPAGTVFELVCDDPGAEEDIPAFCRMTGHALLAREAAPGSGRPLFRIRRRDRARA